MTNLADAVGDQCLQQLAEKLKDSVRTDDTVSRIGGDEFVVLLPDLHQIDTAAHVAEKIIRTIAQPMQVKSLVLNITISIGIAVYPNDGDDFESLLVMADRSMYIAKGQGKNTYQFFHFLVQGITQN